MAVETVSLSNPIYPHGWSVRSRIWRRMQARYRLWRIVTRCEIRLAALDRKQRLDIGRPAPRHYRWLEEMMRGQQRP